VNYFIYIRRSAHDLCADIALADDEFDLDRSLDDLLGAKPVVKMQQVKGFGLNFSHLLCYEGPVKDGARDFWIGKHKILGDCAIFAYCDKDDVVRRLTSQEQAHMLLDRIWRWQQAWGDGYVEADTVH
jgi:hypothetical protein